MENRADSRDIQIFILAAGTQVRFKSEKPKVLNLIAGKSCLAYVLDAVRNAFPRKKITILENDPRVAEFARLREVYSKHTANMAGSSLSKIIESTTSRAKKSADVLVLPGDAPLISSWSLKELVSEFRKADMADFGLLTIDDEDPDSRIGLIRLFRKGKSQWVNKIVDVSHATRKEYWGRESWSGIFCATTLAIAEYGSSLNVKGKPRFYFHDFFEKALIAGARIVAIKGSTPEEFYGLSTRREQTEIGRIIQRRIMGCLSIEGVHLVDPSRTYIDANVAIGMDTTVFPGTVIRGNSRIGKHCIIEEDCTIENSWIPDSSRISRGSQIREKRASCFLSHSNWDKPFARKLGTSLQEAGFRVWIDEAEIRVGDSLIDKIGEALDSIDFLIIVLSRKAVRSEWVRKELNIAMSRQLKRRQISVLPVLIEPCQIPAFLSDVKYADFSNPNDFRRVFGGLSASVSGHWIEKAVNK
jgi:bifunctional N-acetylglucosamine-1-phosphate-uridyltransferase/glucosamine-1-phosphate-acetyltransferase GlmU-like protein